MVVYLFQILMFHPGFHIYEHKIIYCISLLCSLMFGLSRAILSFIFNTVKYIFGGDGDGVLIVDQPR